MQDAIIGWMVPPRSPHLSSTRSGGDLAFAVIVLAAYFSTFSALQFASAPQIFSMILLGIAYLSIGVYGFRFVVPIDTLWPKIIYFLVQIILGSCIIYLGMGLGYNALLLLPLAGHSVMLLPGKWVYVTNTAVMVAYGLVTRLLSNSWSAVWTGLPIFFAGLVFIVVFTQMAVDEEKARREQEKLSRLVEDANRKLIDYALQVEELTVTAERNRLAREIHDGLGHYLTVIHMQIQAVLALLPNNTDQAVQTLESACRVSQEALQDVRRSVAALRSSVDEEKPLPDRITLLLDSCSPLNIHHQFTISGSHRSLNPQIEMTLFRAAQEGVNNACKHSCASQIWITLDYSITGQVKLTVQDDGIGTEELEGGFGLIGLQERIQKLKGDLRIVSSKGQGFYLEITIPV